VPAPATRSPRGSHRRRAAPSPTLPRLAALRAGRETVIKDSRASRARRGSPESKRRCARRIRRNASPRRGRSPAREARQRPPVHLGGGRCPRLRRVPVASAVRRWDRPAPDAALAARVRSRLGEPTVRSPAARCRRGAGVHGVGQQRVGEAEPLARNGQHAVFLCVASNSTRSAAPARAPGPPARWSDHRGWRCQQCAGGGVCTRPIRARISSASCSAGRRAHAAPSPAPILRRRRDSTGHVVDAQQEWPGDRVPQRSGEHAVAAHRAPADLAGSAERRPASASCTHSVAAGSRRRCAPSRRR